jgi:hypothetical protein
MNSPGNNVRQVVTLTSAENDPPANGYQSGIASVAFEYSANGTTWASVGTNTSPPFDNVLWNTALVADGLYQLRIIVFDAAGNSTIDVLGSTIRIDNTPPTTSQNDPGQYLRATKTLTGSASDAGSGIDHVDFERAPTGGGSWTTIATDSTPGDGFQASFDTTSVSDGHYDFRTVAYDVAGNATNGTPVANRLIDNTAPIVQIIAPREPTAVTFGQAPPNGSLSFIQVSIIDKEGDVVVDELGGSDGLLDPTNPNLAAQFARIDDGAAGVGNPNRNVPGFDFRFSVPSGAAGGAADVNVARLFNIAGSEVILLEDGTPAVRTVLNWVVAAPFVGSAHNESFVTFTATVTDANGNTGVASSTFQLTDSAANGQELTPQPNH